MESYASTIALCFKLINKLASKSFTKRLSNPWVGAQENDNIKAVQLKSVKSVKSDLDRFLKHNKFQEIFDYLELLQKEKEVKINKVYKKGILQQLTIQDYKDVDHFICNVSSPFHPPIDMQTSQFECHRLLRTAIDFLIIKDTIENGAGYSPLDNIIQELLNTKPVSFFENGYLADLFVIDRLSCIYSPENIKAIRCYKDYLSTWSTDNAEYEEDAPDRYDVFHLTGKFKCKGKYQKRNKVHHAA